MTALYTEDTNCAVCRCVVQGGGLDSGAHVLRKYDLNRGQVETAITAGRALQEGAALQVSYHFGAIVYCMRDGL